MRIGFIDYSREERNTILSTLKTLGDHTALDELGVGVVRDAYSDILFPGISTLQTRAKYFVLIPYLFHDAAVLATNGSLHSGQDMLLQIQQWEDTIAKSLTDRFPNEKGIIGSNASRQKRSVKIKPTQIYWNGMRTLGILRNNDLSILSVCKVLYRDAKQKADIEIKTDDENYDDLTAAAQDRTLFLPLKADYDYLTQASMDLTKKEAEFIVECIQRSLRTSGSLLWFFVKEGMISDGFFSVPEDILPDKLREDYHLAKDFSRFIYGAHLRYNLIYSLSSDEGIDLSMKEQYDNWLEEMRSDPVDLEPVLKRVSCGEYLSKFCRGFQQEALQGNNAATDELIIHRERQVKGSRAKLCKPGEYRYSPVHDYRLDYRFDTAKDIIQDVLKGLGGTDNV